MKQSITILRLPSSLKRSLQQIAKEQGTTVDQICATALTEHIQAVAPEFLLKDGQGKSSTEIIIRLTNQILRDAMDAAVRLVTIESEAEDFVVYAQETQDKRELLRCPLPWLSSVRIRLQSMAHGTCEIKVEHNGQPGLIRLLSIEPSIIRMEIA